MTASSSPSEPAVGGDLQPLLDQLESAVERRLGDRAELAASAAETARLLRLAVRLRAAGLAAGGPALAGVGDPLTPTEVALVAGHLLEQAEMDVFELAMWKSWGRP
jgi:hypothetical protein